MGRPGAISDAGNDGFLKNYILACCAASVAETVTFPLDITKTRLQIQGEYVSKMFVKNPVAHRGTLRTIFGIVMEEGFRKLFQGLPPAVLRHVVYSGCRMQFYEVIRRENMKRTNDTVFPVWKACVFGMASGAAAQFLASPTDLVKVQMQMEGRRSLDGRPKRLRGTFHAFHLIYKKRGLRGLWRGWLPNCQRAALVNLGDLTTYDSVKHFILRNFNLGDNYVTHTMSSVCSGLVAASLGTPADVIKTRIMNEPELYKGSIDCLLKAAKNEGFLSLYKGFFPTWARMAPWSLTFWLTYEQLRLLASSSSF